MANPTTANQIANNVASFNGMAVRPVTDFYGSGDWMIYRY